MSKKKIEIAIIDKMDNIEAAFVDLVLDSGQIVTITYRVDDMDELYKSLDNARKRSDDWSQIQFEGCSMEFMGMQLDRVCMSRVVGML